MPQQDLHRYSRQILLPGIGESGQRRLLSSHAALVGIGALGCAAADLLARAGVGQLTLIDRDVVELTNLQRQSLFTEADVHEGLPKADAAARRLRAVNSSVSVRPVVADMTSRNIAQLLDGADVIVDGTDNFAARFLINDYAVKYGTPWVYAGALGATGAMMPVVPGVTACLRCTFESMPPAGTGGTCDTVGVWGPAIAAVAAAQCSEVLKLLLGSTAAANVGLCAFDLWAGTSRIIKTERALGCLCCGNRVFEFLDGGASEPARLCGNNSVQVTPDGSGVACIDLASLAARLGAAGEVQAGSSFVRFRPRAESLELTIFADARAIVRGTTEPARARIAYAKYVGA